MHQLYKRAHQHTKGLAVAGAAIASSIVIFVPTIAEANTTTIRSCTPAVPSFTLSLRSQGLPCKQARGIERYRADHDWTPKFRLFGRTWHATASQVRGHTSFRFQSGRRIVWLSATGRGLSVGSSLEHTCTVQVLGGESYAGSSAPALALTGDNKASHDSWEWSPPATLANQENNTWSSRAGTFRSCWNNANYADQYGSVEISVSDPWRGANSESCTTTGNYVCTGPWNFPYNPSVLGGDDLYPIYGVCPTNDVNCFYIPSGATHQSLRRLRSSTSATGPILNRP